MATLDTHTSDICRNLDGKHYPMSEYKAGVTAPPFHVYCRSTTAPYFDDDFGQIGQRAARDENGKTYYVPDNMTYAEWQKAFVGGDKSGLTNAENGGIIKKEIENGNIKLEINPEKQARHIKGRSEYKEGRSYITISEQEAQDIINSKSGTGILVKDRKGNWKHKELIDCGKEIGVFVEPISKNKIPTNKATIHYSKTGTHLVPRK